MKPHRILFIALLGAAALQLVAEAPVSLRRYALIAGSNTGGEGRVRLKYAQSDARSMAAVLEELGGVRVEDLVLLLGPDLARFQDGMRQVRQMVSAPREGEERRELIVYYSGHSDEEGLILGRDRFPYDRLRQEINTIPADVKVAILDSCASGALTRAKGGVVRPAFLFDASADMKGHAFITSSSADEAAQESDRIGGSYFTHYLVSGLRGAADTRGNGVVTLNEAYAFAFKETLASTEKTQYGPQHPAYDIHLTGSGDLVLTDLRTSFAGLTVDEDVAGRLYIRDERGALAVELNKVEGQRTELGLSPGEYSVLLDNKGSRSEAEVRVTARRRAELSLSSLRPIPTDRTTARGSGEFTDSEEFSDSEAFAEADAQGDSPGPDSASERFAESFHISLIPEILGGIFSSKADRSMTINLLIGTSGSSNGFEVAGLANFESRNVKGFQAAGLGNLVLGSVDGFQAAGLVNVAGKKMRFFQAAGLANVALGETRGLQMAGLANVCASTIEGVQSGGLANIALGDARGAQISGLFNWAQEGLQGVQIAGTVNWARDLRGPQISVVNVADVVSGIQLGVVNVAQNVSGVQLGVVNVSKDIDGIPIGIISIVQNGRQKLDLWWDGQYANAAFSLGSRSFYTIFSGRWVPESQPAAWSAGFGFGGRTPLGPAFLDLDLSAVIDRVGFPDTNWASPSPTEIYPRLRGVIVLPIIGEIALMGGVSLRVTITDWTVPTEPRFTPSYVIGVQM